MYPKLKSGDIVVYKLIQDYDDILWGSMYVIDLIIGDDNYTLTKWIQKSDKRDDYIKLVSENRHHEPKDIKKSKILKLGLIKASVRYEI